MTTRDARCAAFDVFARSRRPWLALPPDRRFATLAGMPHSLVTSAPALSMTEGAPAIWNRLRTHGAIILKEAAFSIDAFDTVTEQFAEHFRIHQDPTRQRYNTADTTQSVTAGFDAIGLHAERAYLPARPELLFFCCLTPPASGGATTLCDGAAIVNTLPSEDVRRLASMTLRWRATLDPRMWQRMWSSDDRGDVSMRFAEAMERYGEQTRTRHWFDDAGTLHVDYLAPALSTSRLSGRSAFATYLLLQDDEPDGPHATQADGDPVPPDLMRRIRDAANDQTIDIEWEQGDVAIIDNTRCMHGRRAFTGGHRQILVRMGDARLPSA